MKSLSDDAVTELVYVAASPGELERAAAALEDHDIDYSARPGAFIKPFLGGSVYEGVAFYVLGGQASFARDTLVRCGLKRGVIPFEDAQLPVVREHPLA